VARPRAFDVLLALLGATTAEPVDGTALTRRLERAGHTVSSSWLLTQLLRLEGSGHVAVTRDPYCFALTPFGEQAAYDLGPGTPADLVLVMIDLVGYVAFTDQHGDEAAHRAARLLHDSAAEVLSARAGRVVKALGDGVLGSLPPGADPAPAVAAVAKRCRHPDGSLWPVRASARRGRPITYQGDLFGADVNLVSRLCAAAEPGELVVAVERDHPAAEHLAVRGLVDAVAVTRQAVP